MPKRILSAIKAQKAVTKKNKRREFRPAIQSDWMPQCKNPFGNPRRNLLPLDYNEEQ